MVASAQGLDVSNYNGKFSWAGTTGLSFGICRITQGLGSGQNSPDPDAAWNWAQIKAKGLIRGGYHFLDPAQSGQQQAESYVTELDKLGLLPTDMLFLDNETAGASPAAVSGCAVSFMAELAQLAPHNPRGVYTFIDFAKEGNCAGLSGCPLWLAYPASSAPVPPPPWVKWAFWQWGTRNGVDTDAFNGTAAELGSWIASFAPQAGPYRQEIPYQGHTTLGAIAAARHTTVEHLIEVTAGALSSPDLVLLGSVDLPAGTPFYTSSPLAV